MNLQYFLECPVPQPASVIHNPAFVITLKPVPRIEANISFGVGDKSQRPSAFFLYIRIYKLPDSPASASFSVEVFSDSKIMQIIIILGPFS